MPRKWVRRGIGVAVVAITATLAWAGGGDAQTITANPRLIGVKQLLGSAQAMTVNVRSTTAFTGRIVGTCGAAPAMRIAGGTGDPFTAMPDIPVPVLVECPSTLPLGMHRCTFDIQNAQNISVASFDAFCSTFSAESLTANPINATFTNQQVGVTSLPASIEVTNPTASPLIPISIQVDNPNFLVGKPCQDQTGCDAGKLLANSSQLIDVLCRPLTTGTHTGQLFVVGSNGLALPPLPLTCGTGSAATAPVLTVNPPNVLITPAVEVVSASANKTVELANGGTTGMLSITSISIVDAAVAGAANDWAFTLDGQCTSQLCTLGPAQKLNVRLTFDPSGFNSRGATLVVNYTDPTGTKQVSITLDGEGAGATAQLVGTPSIDFGVVPLNTQAMTKTFKLQNTGTRSTTVTLAAAPKDPFLFPMDLALPPGETIVDVGCFSAIEGDRSVTLAIDGPDHATTLTVPLHCDVRNTQLTTDPTSITLGEVRVGVTVPPITVAIDRVGMGAAIPLTSATLSEGDPNLSLGMLSGLATPATVTLTVTPTTEGIVPSTIIVTPGAGSAVPVPMDIRVVTPGLAADDVMTLGTFCVGQPVTPTTIALTSTGTATVQVMSVALQGGDASPLELAVQEPSLYPTSLAPAGGKATVLVTPKRSETPDDNVSDLLVWTTDAGQVSSTLTTRFVADGGAVAPEQLDFGDVPIHIVNDHALGVTLQNCSVAPLQLIEPAVPAPFELTGEFPLLLEPGAKATFSILFLPREPGEVTRDLTIESMGGDMYSVALRGNGITGDGTGDGGDDDGALDETSFYACGCRSNGNPSGVLVIALAILCCFRRRVSR